MIKTGSKLFYALAGLSYISAILFAAFTGDHKLGMDTLLGPITFGWKGYVGEHVGYTILMGLSVATLAVAILLSALRDADAEKAAKFLDLPAAPPAAVPVSVNYWPAVGAASFACLALGLATGRPLFIVGLIGLAATLFEWTVRAWADHATGDAEMNVALRRALIGPFELPIGGAMILASIVFGMSRILLSLPSQASVAVFAAVPALILAVGALLVMRPRLTQSFVAAAIVVAVLALVIGGVVAAIVGSEHQGSESGSAPTVAGLEVGN